MTTNVEVKFDVRKLRESLRFLPLRFVHVFFCLMLTLYGVGIFLLTITVRTRLGEYTEFLKFYIEKPVVVLIVGSILIVGVGCLGIISAAQNIYQGIITFGVLLFGLFMFKLTLSAVVLATLGSAELSLTQALELHMNNYTNNSDPMDYIQTELSCCGMTDFSDWNSTLGFVPGSCCDSDSSCGSTDILSLNEIGCYEALKSLIDYLIAYLAVILGVLAILQITLMTITFFLARGIADIRRRISACSNESDESSVTEKPEPAPVQNPFGVRRSVPLKENNESSLKSAKSPYPVKIFGRYTLPGGYGDHPSHGMVTSSAPPLPITNRRFPVGF